MSTLSELPFLSGWILTVGIGLLAGVWWFPRTAPAELVPRLRAHLGFSVVLVFFFALHTRLRIPAGWIETILLTLFVLLIASTVAGFCLARGAGESERIRRWLNTHVPLTYGLFAAAMFHGVFVHGHGMLAHVFLDE